MGVYSSGCTTHTLTGTGLFERTSSFYTHVVLVFLSFFCVVLLVGVQCVAFY